MATPSTPAHGERCHTCAATAAELGSKGLVANRRYRLDSAKRHRMSFLNPLVLLGLVAAAIPLIIHLFNFRRPRRVDFSSLTFVRELQKSTMQRVRLKQWLLLLLRTLAIAMLVLAFARPTLTGGLASMFGGRGSSAVALVIDNSASMDLRDAGGSYLDQAKALAQAVAGQLEPGDEAYIVTTTARSGSTDRHQVRASAQEAIDGIEPGMHARPAREVLNEAARILDESQQVNREIYFISDFQRRTLGDSLSLEVPADLDLMLLPVGRRSHSNVAIEDVRVESRIVEAGSPVRVSVSVRNYGDQDLSDYAISLYLGDERVAQAPVDLAAGLTTSVGLVVTPQTQGWLGGRVEGEDDDFPRDNVRFFTLQVPERRRVLLVGGSETDSRYLRLALNTGHSSGDAFFDLQALTGQPLSNVVSRLGEFDAIILAGASPTSSGELATLRDYVTSGGGLFVTPGAGVSMQELSTLLQGLGGGSIRGITGERGGEQAVASVDRVDTEHPVFEGVFESSSGDDPLRAESPRVLSAVEYVPASGTEQTLMRMSNGSPFLQEIRTGRGIVMLLAVGADPTWSDLPVRGIFVPLVFRTLQYLSATEAVQGENLVAGGGAELRLAGLSGQTPVRLVSPFGEETIPEQRPVPGAVLLQVPQTLDIPGIYDVYEGERLVRRLAMNPDAAESDLAQFGAAELLQSLNDETDASIRLLDIPGDAGDAAGEIRAQRTGIELWNVFLLLALLFLVSEMIVARHWRPETVAS